MKKQTLFFILLNLLYLSSYSKPFESNTKTPLNNSRNNLHFIENKGQITDQFGNQRNDILFAANNKGLKLYLKNNGFSYEVNKIETNEKNTPLSDDANIFNEIINKTKNTTIKYHRVDIEFLNCNPNALIIKEGKSEDYCNFYKNNNEYLGVYNYNKITYKNIYPKIDFVYYVTDSGLKYEFIINSGGNIEDIKMKYNGMNNMYISSEGNLVLETSLGNIEENIPFSYTNNEKNIRNNINVVYKIDKNIVSFKAEKYNKNNILTIDPVVIWSTYYGDVDEDVSYGITRYGLNNIIAVGYTNSSFSIATTDTNVFQGAYGGGYYDAFIVNFNYFGVRKWATYYGGNDENIGTAVTTDRLGNIIFTGFTKASLGIPTTGAYQNTYGGGLYDAFVAKFDSLGYRKWGTYFGGDSTDIALSITSDTSDNIIITGYTKSPTEISSANAYQTAYGGDPFDAFVAKFDSSGAKLWSTYYGGSDIDAAYGIKADGLLNINITGFTKSTSDIATDSAFQTNLGSIGVPDAFVAKFDATGNIKWGTYYGGTGIDRGYGLDNDSCGYIAITGYTKSTNGIATNGTHQTTLAGNEDAFLAKFDYLGNRIWGSYFGGPNDDRGYGINMSPISHYIAVTGSTKSSTGISTPQPPVIQQVMLGGVEDAFIADFSPLCTLRQAAYLGGVENDRGLGICGKNRMSVSGLTFSTDSISTSGSHQPTFGGGNYEDAFITNFVFKPRLINLTWDCDTPGFSNCSISCIPYTPADCAPVTLTLHPPPFDDDDLTNSYIWYCPGAVPPTSTSQNPTFTWTQSGSFTISLVVYNQAGQDSIVFPLAVTVLAPPNIVACCDDTICPGDSIQLNATGGISYTWTPSGTLSNDTIPNPYAFPDVTTTYTVIGVDAYGCTAMDNVTITVFPSVVVSPDDSICLGQSIQLNATGATNYSWDPSNSLNNPNIANPIASPTSTTTYYITGTNNIGCQDIDSVTIHVFLPLIVNVDGDTSICAGNTVPLYASGGISYIWSPSNSLNNDTIANPLASPLVTTTYYVTISNGICSTTDSVLVYVGQTLQANCEYVFEPNCDNIIGRFNNTSQQITGIKWQFSNGFTSTDISFSYNFNYGDSVDIYLIVYDSSCTDTFKLNNPLNFSNEYMLPPPNVITPNGDNMNDCFRLSNNDYLDDCYTYEIFNRWGKKVFVKDSEHKCWDGKNQYNGKDLDDGVYFYILTIGGKTFQGSVTLMR